MTPYNTYIGTQIDIQRFTFKDIKKTVLDYLEIKDINELEGESLQVVNNYFSELDEIEDVIISIPIPSYQSMGRNLSGVIYISEECRRKHLVKGIILANHYTIGANKEAPSQSLCHESYFTKLGYAVVMSDYISFGARPIPLSTRG